MVNKLHDRVTLTAVVNKVRAIAIEEYDNHVYENILSIFNQLETEEKRVLLRGMVSVVLILEEKAERPDEEQLNRIEEEIHSARASMHQDVENIEEYNRLELIRLRSWFIKAGSIILFLGVVLMLAMFVFLGNDMTTLAKVVSGWSDVVNTVIGTGS